MLGRIAIFVFLANLVLLIAAVADCLGGESKPRRAPRGVWVAFIVLVPIVGGIMWFTSGRPRRHPGGGTRPAPGRRPNPSPLAPDDDPEFLADLERRLREDGH